MSRSHRRIASLSAALLALAACGGGGSDPAPKPECSVPSDCGADTACRIRTCTGGVCGISDVAAGTAIAAQTAGDCQEVQCDGSGGTTSVALDADLPADDGQECTGEACSGGAPIHPPAAPDAPCTQGGGTVCDGAGACVECNAPGQCPGSDTFCQVRTCDANTCGVSNTGAGTALPSQTTGDCREVRCDGSGGTTSVALDADLPADDGNACTGEACSGGVPLRPGSPPGTPCPGGTCNGAGVCIAAPVTVTATSPADGATSTVPTPVSVTFSTEMAPASLTAQTAFGACAGSLQLSADDFVSCWPFASASPSMSVGDTVATLTPQPGLLVNRNYKLRVTTAAASAAAVPLESTYTSATGFATLPDGHSALNESGAELSFCAVYFPASLDVQASTTTSPVYGRVFQVGVTDAPGPNAGLTAQLGFGPATANPEYETGWTWFDATWNVQVVNDDEYQATFTAPSAGSYRYAYRFSGNGGTSWIYCDSTASDGGAGSATGLTFELSTLPVMTVTP